MILARKTLISIKQFEKILRLIVINCSILSSLLVLAEEQSHHTPKITFILPLSGEHAALGVGIKNGALLAQTDLERSKSPPTLIFEDNHGDLSKSSLIASSLVSSQKPDAIISIISGVGQVIKPIALRTQTTSVCICSDTTVADGKYNFINYLTAEQGATKYVEHFIKTYGADKKLAIFSQNEAGFDRIVSELQGLVSSQIKIVAVEKFNSGTSDFKSQILRVEKLHADALLILGLSPEIELLAKQLKASNNQAPLTSIESFGLAQDKTPFIGGWYVDSARPSPEFATRYKKIYGIDPTPGVGHAYDTVMLLSAALKNSQSLLEIKNYQGVTGALAIRLDGIIWSDGAIVEFKK